MSLQTQTIWRIKNGQNNGVGGGFGGDDGLHSLGRLTITDKPMVLTVKKPAGFFEKLFGWML